MVYLACQHDIKMVVMWYDGMVSSFERFKWSDLAHVHGVVLFRLSQVRAAPRLVKSVDQAEALDGKRRWKKDSSYTLILHVN